MKHLKLPVFVLFCLLFLSIPAFALEVEILPEDATDNDDLTCNIVGVSREDEELFDHYWYVNREFAEVSRELDNSNTDAGDSVMCYVTDSFGFFVGSDTITILPAPEEGPENRRPSVEITSPTRNLFEINERILFTASASDPDGDGLTYRWDFGDDTTASSRTASHSYNRAGFFVATVTVSDGELSATDRIVLGIREEVEEKEVNERPVAVIDASDRFVGPGDLVVLNALRSHDPDGRITSYEWILRPGAEFAFGDSNDPLITLRFNRNGFHRIDLRVTDNDGATDAEFVLILVSDVFAENERPVADMSADNEDVFAGETVNFDGSESYDPDGEIVNYNWDFGDGTTGTGINPSHIYNTPGGYEVTLTVTDDDGATDADDLVITVFESEINQNPVADISVDSLNGFIGFPLNFDGSESYDPDGTIVSYLWDFGDGAVGAGVNPSHVYNTPGGYEVTLTVTDDDGATDADDLVITVFDANQNPVADISTDTLNGFIGFPLNFDGSGSYDPDGTIVSYLWDFGDGTTSNSPVVSHTFVNDGTYTVVLMVTDNDGAVDEESVDVVVGLIDRGLDVEKRSAILRSNNPDFSFGRILPSVEKSFYNKGENIVLFVKIANEAGRDADLDFELTVPEFNYQYNINNINLDSGQVKFITAFVNVPENAAAGNYVARLSLDSGEEIKRDYWQFYVA